MSQATNEEPKQNPEFLKKNKRPPTGKPRYFLGEHFPGIYLTQREADCAVLALQRMSNPKIGRELGLSDRTVEFYINNVKNKVQAKRRPHLLRLLMCTDIESIYRRAA